MTLSSTKRALRKTLRSARKNISHTRLVEEARLCTRALLTTELWKRAHTIGLYWPIHSELDPNLLLDHPESLSKRFAWPVSHPATHSLTFHTLPSARYGFFGAQRCTLDLMQRDAYNIPAPVEGPSLDPSTLDLLLVPALGFDRRGFRIGYGKGFYDRFLPSLSPTCATLGVCGSWQLLDTLPHDGHDLPVQYVLTQKGVLPCAP